MEDKPFDRFTDKPPRREREDRFSDRPFRRFDRESRFEEREERFADRGERRFGFRGDREGFRKVPRRDFGTRSGPRARAVDRHRYTDHADFVKTATVRLEADVAEYFKTPEAVNDALRHVIALSEICKKKEEVETLDVKEETVTTEGSATAPETQD